MLVVTTADWNAVPGRMVRYERARPGKHWKQVGEPVEIVVGKSGLGWGIGLVSTDDAKVRGAADPVKHEGDGKAPAGVFGFSSGFGYAAEKPAEWKMPYVSLTPTVECVDDAGSRFYNRVVDRAAVTADWKSSERMAEAGVYYRWGAVIDHNWNPPVPGGGSCIFLHVWGGAEEGTVGCTAMAEEELKPVLAWIDPARKPVFVQLPQAQYKKLRKPWRLPKPPPLANRSD
jgi:D-alanyl-D-alanine dipeptidase